MQSQRPVPFIDVFLEDDFHNLRLSGLNGKIADLVIFLVDSAPLHRLIAKRYAPAGIIPLLGQLFQPGFYPQGGLDALPGGLPVTDIVQEFIHMGVKTLLTFHGAPDFNALLDKPLHDKRRFIVPAAQAVKHENQQNIKLAFQGHFLNFLYCVSVLGGDFEAGNSFFGKFFHDLPAGLPTAKLPAILLLHGNVVLFHLAYRGYTVKAHHTLFDSLSDQLRNLLYALHDFFSHIYLSLSENGVYMAAGIFCFQGAIYTIIISYLSKICKKSDFSSSSAD